MTCPIRTCARPICEWVVRARDDKGRMRCRYVWSLGAWRYVLAERCAITGALRDWKPKQCSLTGLARPAPRLVRSLQGISGANA